MTGWGVLMRSTCSKKTRKQHLDPIVNFRAKTQVTSDSCKNICSSLLPKVAVADRAYLLTARKCEGLINQAALELHRFPTPCRLMDGGGKSLFLGHGFDMAFLREALTLST